MRQNWNTEVYVLDPNGVKLGKMQFSDAQNIAKNQYSLDLIQINKNNDLPVFKIMDQGEYKYNKTKQKKSITHHLKEMTFRVCIDVHDMKTKIKRIQKFLFRGDEVKISITMRGREKSRPELAREKLNDILFELGYDNQDIKSTESSIMTILRPIRSSKGCQEQDTIQEVRDTL